MYPEVQGNKIKFDAYLEESNHPKLLSNMNLQLLIVRRMKDDVLRLEQGPGIGRGKKVELYMVANNKLIKREVVVGLRGQDYIEIRSGIQAGEEVIVSETDEFRNRPEIDISH